MARSALLLTLVLAGTACDREQFRPEVPLVPAKPGPGPVAARTTLLPPPGPFNERLTVRLETDVPATLYLSTDGSDPKVEGPGRRSGPSPLELELSQTTTLRFFSRTPGGAEETEQAATYTRAGAARGTVSGVVVIDTLALDKDIGLSVNGSVRKLGRVTSAQELPFLVSDLGTGQHRLSALADRNGDGNFWPVVDLASDTLVVELDLNNPFKASVEGLRILLGASQPGLGTIKGTVTLPEPPAGQNLSVSALSPELLGAGADPSALLSQLQNGYQVFTNAKDTRYPYAITDLKPGRYLPTPVLTGFGAGGLAMNFVVNPFRIVNLSAGETKTVDHAYGSISLSGTVTLKPSKPPQGFVYGVVAAKHVSLSAGVQGVLMPTVFLPQPGQPLELHGNYAGKALRDNSTFQLRVFTNEAGGNPLTESLAWVVMPLGGQPPHTTVPTGTRDQKVDFTVP